MIHKTSTSGPDGLGGNDDCAMSGVYFFVALGF